MATSPTDWTIVAHDYHSPALRNYIWVNCFDQYPSLLEITRPLMGIISTKDEIQYIADLEVWTKCHEELKAKCLADSSYLEKLIDATNDFGETLTAWTQKNVFTPDLAAYSNDQLASLFESFIEKQGTMYAYGVAVPILDFAGFSFVENNLNKILETVAADKRDEYYRVFTAPAHNSYALDQEEALLTLMTRYWLDAEWRKNVVTLEPNKLSEKYPDFWHDLSQHAAAHAWVYYVYTGPAYTEKDFLGFIIDYLEKDVDPTQKLTELEDQRAETERLKQEYIKQLNPDPFQLMILNLAGKVVWAKPRRKDYQSKAYYHMEKALREVGNRLNITLEQARSLFPHEIRAHLEKPELAGRAADEIFDNHAVYCNPEGGVTALHGPEARTFAQNFFETAEEGKDTADEFKGNCARQGSARGIVKIVNSTEDMHKMERGNILVSKATSPSVVPAMKKAAAILTDEGGLTCHAAIVSRELGIPCIVGLKTVTRTLKDGDFVEVDATKGIVRRVRSTEVA